jgi:hypothetical protein
MAKFRSVADLAYGARFRESVFLPDISATSQMLSDLALYAARDGASLRVITSRQRLTDVRANLPTRERLHGVDVYRVWSTSLGRGSLPGVPSTA